MNTARISCSMLQCVSQVVRIKYILHEYGTYQLQYVAVRESARLFESNTSCMNTARISCSMLQCVSQVVRIKYILHEYSTYQLQYVAVRESGCSNQIHPASIQPQVASLPF